MIRNLLFYFKTCSVDFILILISLLIMLFVLTDGDFNINKKYFFSNVFHNMWEHLKHFNLEIDKNVIRDEAFVINGKYYAYFLPLPALIRGFFEFFNLGQSPIPSVLLACLIFLTSSLSIFKSVLLTLNIPEKKLGKYVFLLKVFLTVASPILMMLAYPLTYWEAIIWGMASLILSIAMSLIVLRSPLKVLNLILFSLICTAALYTRPTVAVAIFVLFFLTLFNLYKLNKSVFNNISFYCSILFFSSGIIGLSLMNYYKWGNPFEFAPLQYYSLMWTPEHYEKFIELGVIRLDRLSESIAYYFIPTLDNLDKNFPFIKIGSFLGQHSDKFDYVEGSLPIGLVMPLFLILAVYGVICLIRDLFSDKKFVISKSILIPGACASVIPGLIMLPWFALSVRYIGEFITCLTFLFIIGSSYLLIKIIEIVPEKGGLLKSVKINKIMLDGAIGLGLIVSFYLLLSAAWLQHQGWFRNWAYLTPTQQIQGGETIYFNKNASGPKYLEGVGSANIMGWGWSYPEEWGVWSEGSMASILFEIDRTNSSYTGYITLKPYYINVGGCFNVEIWVDESFVTKECIRKKQITEVEFKFPSPDLRNVRTKFQAIVTLKFEKVYSPAEVSSSDDSRKLGIGLYSIRFEKN